MIHVAVAIKNASLNAIITAQWMDAQEVRLIINLLIDFHRLNR